MTKYTEFYHFNSKTPISIKNEKNEIFVIDEGDTLEFFPNFIQNKPLYYRVLVNSNSKEKMLTLDNIAANKIISCSRKERKIVGEIFKLSESNVLLHQMSIINDKIVEMLKNKDLIQNHAEVKKIINDFKIAANYVDELVDNPLSTKDAIPNFFNMLPTLKINTDLPIDKKHYQYIKEVDSLVVDGFANLKMWIDEQNVYMVKSGLKDVEDFLELSYFFNNDLLYSAHEKMANLDTVIREQFSKEFWEDFVLENDSDNLKVYEDALIRKIKLDNELSNKEHVKTKHKV